MKPATAATSLWFAALSLVACADEEAIPPQTWNSTEWVPLVCEPGPSFTVDRTRYVGEICAAEEGQ